MKKLITFGCLFLLLPTHVAFAGANETYFSGQGFERAKAVQILGVPRNIENLEREDHVGEVVRINLNKLKFCHEKALTKSFLPRVESTFYFVVSNEGAFSNVTADLINAGSASPNTEMLFACASKQIKTFRASKWSSGQIFRFNVIFEEVR